MLKLVAKGIGSGMQGEKKIDEAKSGILQSLENMDESFY